MQRQEGGRGSHIQVEAILMGVACANVLQHDKAPDHVFGNSNCMDLIEETGMKGKERGYITHPGMIEVAGIDDFQHFKRGDPYVRQS